MPVNEIQQFCEQLRPLIGDKARELYVRYSLATTNEERQEIGRVIYALYQKHFGSLDQSSVPLIPPEASAVSGDYFLGDVLYGGKTVAPAFLRSEDFARHVCVSGMSGSGKTTFGFVLLEQFLSSEKPFLVFDWKKSFRPLLSLSSNIHCFTVGNNSVSNLLKVNVLVPPRGVSPKEWVTVLCDLLTESFFASYGVHKILLEGLDELYREWEIYDGSDYYPTWHHLKKLLEQKLRQAKPREAGWVESALRIATVMTFGSFGEVVNEEGRLSFKVEDLLEKQVILELNALSGVEKKFFCEYILAYLYKYKKAQEYKSGNRLDSIILVDEAHNIFLKDKPHFVQESVTDMVYREMREYGVGLICLDQHISKLSDTVTGNSACHVAFQQQLPQDIETISQLMRLKEHQDLFSRLPVGRAVVKYSDRVRTPFVMQVPPSSLRSTAPLSDTQLKERMKFLISGHQVEKGPDSEFREQVVSPEPPPTFPQPSLPVSAPPLRVSLPPPEKPTLSPPRVSEPEIVPLVQQDTPSLESSSSVPAPLRTPRDVMVAFAQERLFRGDSLGEIEQELLTRREFKGVDPLEVWAAISDAHATHHSSPSPSRSFEAVERPQPSTPSLPSLPVVPSSSVSSPPQPMTLQRTSSEVYSDERLTSDHHRLLQYLLDHPNHSLSSVALYKEVDLSARKGTRIKDDLLSWGFLDIEELRYDQGWKKLLRLKK